MRIFRVMVKRYINYGIGGVPMDTGYAPMEPEELSAYDRDIENARRMATRHGHFELLRLGLQHLLGRKDVVLEKFYNSEFGWDEAQLRVGLEYMYRSLYPDDPIPEGGPPGVELVACGWETWNVTMPGSPDEPPPANR